MRSRICKCCGERIGDHRNICASCEAMEDERDDEKGEIKQEVEHDEQTRQ